jgi:hypothetical protein
MAQLASPSDLCTTCCCKSWRPPKLPYSGTPGDGRRGRQRTSQPARSTEHSARSVQNVRPRGIAARRRARAVQARDLGAQRGALGVGQRGRRADLAQRVRQRRVPPRRGGHHARACARHLRSRLGLARLTEG